MAQENTPSTMSCLYCGKKFGSAMSLAVHMDTRHEGWVEAILEHIHAPLGEVAPEPEDRSGNANGDRAA
jgi:hypothetical protein